MEIPWPLKYFRSILSVLVSATTRIMWYTSFTILTLEQGRKKVSTYMVFEGDATLITLLNFFKVPLKSHILFLYDSPSIFKGIDIPFSTSKGLVVIVVINNPTPISFAWLVICINRIIGCIHPRNAELDIFIMVVIASLL
jgi:hypothetical protein